MLSVALFRILYHQSITIVAHGQLVLGDTFGYLDNFCILEGPSDREACTHCTYLASVHAPRHTPKGERKVLRYFLPYRIYMPPARHTVYSPLTFRFEPNLCHDQLPFKELEKNPPSIPNSQYIRTWTDSLDVLVVGATVVRPSPYSTSSATLSTTRRVPRAGRAYGTTRSRHSARYAERCSFQDLISPIYNYRGSWPIGPGGYFWLS